MLQFTRLGVDVSKSQLDLCLLLPGKPVFLKANNTKEGYEKIFKWLASHGISKALIVMESTGLYGMAFAKVSYAKGFAVAIVNARRIKDFARSKGRRNKTDAADALIIVQFGADKNGNLPLWEPLSDSQQTLRDLMRRRLDVEGALRAEKNRMESADSEVIRDSVQRFVECYVKELRALDAAVKAHVKSNPSIDHDVKLLKSVPGFGFKTACWLVAEIPPNMKNGRALAAWPGLTPCNWESGTLRKAATIGHAAPHLRHLLYFPAITAMRCNMHVRPFIERLRAAGKAKLSIAFAVLHKLIRAAFSMLKNQTPYNPVSVAAEASS